MELVVRMIRDGRLVRLVALFIVGAAAVVLTSPALASMRAGLDAKVREVAQEAPRVQLAGMDEMGGGMGGGQGGMGKMGGMGAKPSPDGGGHGTDPQGESPKESPGAGDPKMENHMKGMHHSMDKMPAPAGSGVPQGGAGGSPGSDEHM